LAGAERRFEEHLTGYTAYLRRPFAKFIVFYERMIHVASTGRSEKGWPRYHQKEFLAGQSNKQHLAGPLPYFLQVTDLFFRPLFAFFIIELKSRKVIHVNVTRAPTDPWVAQQLREATPYGQTPT
jgi:hypothetical protein